MVHRSGGRSILRYTTINGVEARVGGAGREKGRHSGQGRQVEVKLGKADAR